MILEDNELKNKLDFFSTIAKLKDIARAGWQFHGISNGESVADHSFQVAIMAMFLATEIGVDQNKSVLMALIHDIGESIIGDKITERGITRLQNHAQKQLDERAAVRFILSKIGMENYLELFDELVANKTSEAQFVNQLDKLEMAIQAHKYEQLNGIDLGEFYINARKHITNKVLLEILNQA
jgi:putative hydrolase of HD superfamily